MKPSKSITQQIPIANRAQSSRLLPMITTGMRALLLLVATLLTFTLFGTQRIYASDTVINQIDVATDTATDTQAPPAIHAGTRWQQMPDHKTVQLTTTITSTISIAEDNAIDVEDSTAQQAEDDVFQSWNQRNKVTRAGDYPVRIQIPAIDVDAPIEALRDNGSAKLTTPQNPAHVGWYRQGAIPGENGNVVMAGHLDRVDGSPAVFWELDQLTAGDAIIVYTKNKSEYHYTVKEIESYAYENAPIADIFGFGLISRLNLITCRGLWNGAEQTYTERLVVYTELTDIIE